MRTSESRTNREIVRTEANRLIGHRGRTRITRGRGTVRRTGILANRPQSRTMQLTQPAGSAERITLENVGRGHQHVTSAGKKGTSPRNVRLSPQVITSKTEIRKDSLGLCRP